MKRYNGIAEARQRIETAAAEQSKGEDKEGDKKGEKEKDEENK